jgi:arabinose-5-phosphate isomerase
LLRGPINYNYMHDTANAIIDKEIRALNRAKDVIAKDDLFIQAVDIMYHANKIIVSGIGKSGYVARKIAATLASTGKMAMFVHPSEASHGDLGLITKKDALLLLSHSGETRELLDIASFAQHQELPIIAISGNGQSTIASCASIPLILDDIEEAFNNIPAPTSSAIAMMALGDALAGCLAKRRNFSIAQYNLIHPGGALGKICSMVKKFMLPIDQISTVGLQDGVDKAIMLMLSSSTDVIAVLDSEGYLIGSISQQDICSHNILSMSNIGQIKVGQIMNKEPLALKDHCAVIDAINTLRYNAVQTAMVVDGQQKLLGIVQLSSLNSSGIIG